MKNFIFIAMATLIIVACKKKKTEGEPHYKTLQGEIEWVHIASGTTHGNSSNNSSRVIRIADSWTWKEFLSTIDRNDLKDQVDIDFNTYQIVGVVDLVRYNHGYSVKIVDMDGNQQKIAVTSHTTYQQQNNLSNTEALSLQSYHLVKIPLSKQPLSLEELPMIELPPKEQ